MVAPVVVAGGIAAGTALAQAYGNYRASQEAKSASDAAMEQAAEQRRRAREQLLQFDPESLRQMVDLGYLDELPAYDPLVETYTPEQLQYIQAAAPEEYQYLGAIDPTLIQDSAARDLQMQALADLQTRSEQGLGAQDEAGFLAAQRRAALMSRGREGAIVDSLRSRGMSGSGLEATLRNQSAQAAAEELGQIEAQRAAAAADTRTQALQAMMSGAGNVRGQDINVSAGNADILNQMALDNSTRQQSIMNNNVQLRNQSAQEATAEKRRLQDMNVGEANNAQLINQTRTMAADAARQEAARQDILRSGGAKADIETSIYGAKSSQAGQLSNAELGGLSDIYAQGSANADSQRQMYQSLGAVPQTFMSSYLQGMQLAKK